MPRALAAALMLALMWSGAHAQERRETPYRASIAAGEAMMRTGPGRNYPATWHYRRADLPIRVIEVYASWRKIEDPDGETGWMHVNLLSDARTALVIGDAPRPMRENPAPASRVRYLAEPGVVGRLSKCDGQWCQLDVKGRRGFISTDHLWGVDPGERF